TLSLHDALPISDTELDVIRTKIVDANLTVRIYRTYAGYHLFVTSLPIPYHDSVAKRVLNYFSCDVYYRAFSCLTGYRVRLNPKIRSGDIPERIAATYVETVGSALEDTTLVELMGVHD